MTVIAFDKNREEFKKSLREVVEQDLGGDSMLLKRIKEMTPQQEDAINLFSEEKRKELLSAIDPLKKQFAQYVVDIVDKSHNLLIICVIMEYVAHYKQSILGVPVDNVELDTVFTLMINSEVRKMLMAELGNLLGKE